MEELYTLDREVGRGSYGVVFEGRASKTGSRVALKRLACSSPEAMELYLQELWAMRTTARAHPNVIALHAVLLQTGARTLRPLGPGRLPLDLVEAALKGRVSGPRSPRRRSSGGEAPARCRALWLVMEFCDGGDLNRYLLSRPADERRDRSVVEQLSRALAFLHRLGITHRDLKPDNVLVQDRPGGPVIKVADFGLSKMSEGPGEGEGGRQLFWSTCGSDFYMAPEVWAGAGYTAQADVFSLGVVFWAVLERITLLEEGTTHPQLGTYIVCRQPLLILYFPHLYLPPPPRRPPGPGPHITHFTSHITHRTAVCQALSGRLSEPADSLIRRRWLDVNGSLV
uniref:Protein kinase domain-containing protein n=1 Tax=Gadus morhua TaxID=8049 RepID=A0A8C5CD68_GADMO